MRVKYGSASEAIKSAHQVVEAHARETKSLIDHAATRWTDRMKTDFYNRYMIPLSDAQDQLKAELQSISHAVASIESTLNQNRR